MSEPTDASTDKGIGLSMALIAVALIAAALMAVTAPDVESGWAFAGAMTAGTIAVVAIHLFWS